MLQCGSTIPHCPIFPCTDTRVYNQRDTLTPAIVVSGYATILICFINTHAYKHKTHSYTHRKSGQYVQAGQPKPLCPGEGVVTVWVYVCLMVSNSITGFCYCQWHQNLSDVIHIQSGRTLHRANPHTAVANVHSSGSSQSSPSHWKISVC